MPYSANHEITGMLSEEQLTSSVPHLFEVQIGNACLLEHGEILFADKKFRTFFNIDSDDVTGKNLSDFYYCKYLSNYLDTILGSTENQRNEYELYFEDEYGKKNCLRVLTSPVSSSELQFLHIAVIDISGFIDRENLLIENIIKLRDKIQHQHNELSESNRSLIDTNVTLRREIRDRKKAILALQSSESRFRSLTETTSDFIWEINREGYYTYASPKISDLLGYHSEDLIGTTFLVLRNHTTASKFIREIEICSEKIKGFHGWQSSHKHRDGHTVVIESSGIPIISAQGELTGFRGIDRDVTERFDYQKKLKRAKEEAEAANFSKSEFLANMSHELRTPLHAILSFSKFGQKKIGRSTDVEIKKYFHQISTSAKRLMPLINSLLDLSKLESGKMSYSFSELDIIHEVNATVTELTPLALLKDVGIIIKPNGVDTKALFDQNRIGQVLRNILSNAIKFSFNATKIEIFFTNHFEKCQEFLKVSITNTGIGIPTKELDSIFDKFVQSSKTKTGAGGTGLGLSICKQIIEDHQGKIWAEDADGEITTFHFTLPRKVYIKKLGEILVDKGLVTFEDIEKALKDQG